MRTTQPTAPTPAAAVPPQEPHSTGHPRATTVSAEAAERGATSIADRVVARMAAAAAGEVEQVGGSGRRVLGLPAGRRDAADRAPQVQARVHGSVATIAVHLSVAYPASVATATKAVRARITDRVAALAGITVRTVDITVTALNPPPTQGRVIA